MKCADLPDLDVLTAIAATNRPLGATLGEVTEALSHYPAKVVRAKLSKLLRRGVITGCACGCRGDFFVVAVEQALERFESVEANGLSRRALARAAQAMQDRIDAALLAGSWDATDRQANHVQHQNDMRKKRMEEQEQD